MSWFCNNPHCQAFTGESREVALNEEHERQRIAAAKALALAQLAFTHSPVSRVAMRQRAGLSKHATWKDIEQWIEASQRV